MKGERGKYIVGEAYGSLGSNSSKAGTAQKLLQLERILCFLLAKHGVPGESILDAVAAVFLFGPHLDSAVCTTLALAISHFKTALPLMFQLSQENRFIALATPHASSADANTFLLSLEVAKLGTELRTLSNDVSGLRAEMKAGFAELKAMLASP